MTSTITEATETPDVSQRIQQARQATEQARTRLLTTFSFVPDEKLEWSPAPTARHALWIAAHCGAANRAFAALLQGEPLPLPSDPAVAAQRIRNAGKDIPTREAAVALVNDSTDEVLAALDTVTPERMGSLAETPFGQTPFAFWLNVPADHMEGHAHQINYLQTIWGDIEDHR